MRRGLVGLAWLLLAVLIANFFVRTKPTRQSDSSTSMSLVGSTMGSSYRIEFRVPTDFDVELARDRTRRLVEFFAEADELWSTWRTTSQLSRFNQQPTTEWFEVDAQTIELMELANQLHQIDRRYDVTVASLSPLWGFGPHADKGRANKAFRSAATSAADNGEAGPWRPPEQSVIDECLKYVGADKVEVRKEPPALRKLHPQVTIDLSSIVAGFVADRIAKRLLELKLPDFYVDVAGEIVVHGSKDDGEPWRIGIAEPIVGSLEIDTKLELSDCAIATSGNYRNFVLSGGKQLGHIIDPTTGRPAATNVLSATVIDNSCARADGIATLLMTMSAEEGLALANQHGWTVLLLIAGADGHIERQTSQSFERTMGSGKATPSKVGLSIQQ